MKNLFLTLLAGATFAVTTPVFAKETNSEKANTSLNETGDHMKEAGRDVSDKVCETVNGKTNCVAKKMKHKMQTMGDKTKTKAQEVKDKVD